MVCMPVSQEGYRSIKYVQETNKQTQTNKRTPHKQPKNPEPVENQMCRITFVQGTTKLTVSGMEIN